MTKQKKSTFRILFYLKKNSPNKNGLSPIMGRITINGKIAQFSTKLECDPKQWDLKFGRIAGRSEEAVRINERITAIRNQLDAHYHAALRDEGFVSADKIKNALFGITTTSDTLLALFEKHNEDYRQKVTVGVIAKGTYEMYLSSFKHLKTFIRDKFKRTDLGFRELTEDFIEDFDLYLRCEKKFAVNTVCRYVMPLDKIANLAVKKGIIRINPFNDYKFTTEDPNRSFLTKEEVEQIGSVVLKNKSQELVRDVFLFSCFTGLAYIDVTNLQNGDIQKYFDGSLWIVIRRQKTDVPSYVKLLDIPLQIIEKYQGLGKGETVFPFFKPSYVNKLLNKIASQTDIKKHISYHTARHTFATLFLTEGVPIESVSRMMGHTNIKTTQIYAKITNEKISRDMDMAAEKLKRLEKSISLAIYTKLGHKLSYHRVEN